MTLTAPATMSTIGDARQVRHLRAAGKSWAVWTFDDDGAGERFVVRERTGVITLVGNLRTDGTDFSDRILPIDPRHVENFHCLELATNEVAFLFSDGKSVFTFLWNVLTNTILQPITELAKGDLPSQFEVTDIVRRFYVRDLDVMLRVGASPEVAIIDPTATEALDVDVVRKAETAFARYAGIQAVHRDLALPFLADADTVLCYDGSTELVSVTEALPPGTVSWWTFDSADFSGDNAIDLVSSNTASLVGTAPTSVAGQINQARQFLTGSGSGHYNAGNPASLRITGDLSLSFWAKTTTPQNYHHPIHKAYGGEYSTIFYPDGSGYFYYGTSGANAAPYFGHYVPPGTFPHLQWFHGVWTRDFTNKIVRLFIDNRIVAQFPTQGSAAVVSSNSVELGNATNWTNTRFAGQLDEVIIANQAWSPQTVSALYNKGVAGLKANVSGSGNARRVIDLGSGARHAFTTDYLQTAKGLSLPATFRSGLAAAGSSFSPSSAFTIEARLLPRWHAPDERTIFTNRTRLDWSSSGVRTPGGVELAYTVDGLLIFRFDTASATVELRQTGGLRLRHYELNHVAVSHTFGSGAGTILVVNGDQVPTRWVGGTGNENPTPSGGAPAFHINPCDELLGVRVSNIAKSLTAIRNYLRGRS